ncbi:MAG: glycosyltransferase [Sphingomonadales bacterium]|nr:glycosyltransferase [Sphingomonadales bacterium]
MFSVIVPVYNTAGYIEACIQSLLSQDQTDFEIIAIDDGSTDNSLQILKGLAEQDKRLRIYRQENAGQGMARNFGLSKACGLFVAFVDSDDTVAPGLFSSAAQHLLDPELDVVSFGIVFRDSAGRTVATRSAAATFSSSGDSIFLDAMLDKNFLSVVWNKVYRRALLVENGITFPKLRAYEDSVFSRNVARHARKVLYMKDQLYFALTRHDSTSRAMSVRSFDLAAEMIDYEREIFYASVEKPAWRAAFSAHVARFFAYLIILSAFRIDDNSERMDCLKIANAAGFSKAATDRQARTLLNFRVKVQIFLARRPRLLRRLALAARQFNLVPY